MSVRPLRPRDEPAVRSLQYLLEYADPALVTAALDGPFVGRVAVEAEEREHSGDGRVVGYAVAMPGAQTTLSELAVAPDCRRAGHGRGLVSAVAVAAGASELVVTTPPENEAALAFYRALGFVREARLESFYRDGSDALRLRRRE